MSGGTNIEVGTIEEGRLGTPAIGVRGGAAQLKHGWLCEGTQDRPCAMQKSDPPRMHSLLRQSSGGGRVSAPLLLVGGMVQTKHGSAFVPRHVMPRSPQYVLPPVEHSSPRQASGGIEE